MKKFNNIMEKFMNMNFLFRWLITTPLMFVFIAVSFYFLTRGSTVTITEKSMIMVSILLSSIMGLMVSLLYGMAKQSIIFWKAAKDFEEAIEAISNKEELEAFYDKAFQDLRKKAMGGPHFSELRRLHTLVNTKHKYMCNN